MNSAERSRFDQLAERVIATLPPHVIELFEHAPLIIEDKPTDDILREFEMQPEDDDDMLCGLYTGTPLIERSVEGGPDLPDHIYIFRRGIIEQAGGWEESTDEEGRAIGGELAIEREIRITILHEVGHHFGLDEDDLTQMGYD